MCNSLLASAPGTPPSGRTSRGPISFFSLSLDPCNQGFDLKSGVVQTLRGQTIETGIQLELVIIFCHC